MPQAPIFIPTKGRWNSCQTAKYFLRCGIPFFAVVEKQELDLYVEALPGANFVVLPESNQGVSYARNYIWDLCEMDGFERFWMFDDNIRHVSRFNRNLQVVCGDRHPMDIAEHFALRYCNLPFVGFNYEMMVLRRSGRMPPYYLNTRIYSAFMIDTRYRKPDGSKFRFECYFNEDTDLALQYLKAGYCTVLFNAFLAAKGATMKLIGGNTEEYRKTNNRLEFVRELQVKHPDCVAMTKKWGRWHHQVDYARFKQRLRFAHDYIRKTGVNEFGVELIGERVFT